MAMPPPRPPPPSTSRLKSRTEMDSEAVIEDNKDQPQPQSRTHSGDFGSSMETDGGTCERRRSNTYSEPAHRSKSPSALTSSPPPPLPSHPALPLSPRRQMSSSPERGGRGRGVAKVTSDSRSRPSRPPPPAKAKSLPRGARLKMWEQNGDIGRPHSMSYDNVHLLPQDGLNLKSLTRTAVLDLVLDGDQKRPLSADNTPEHSAEVKTDATPASNSTNEPPDNDVQVPAGNSDTPSSPSPHITKSTPSPSSSSVPTTQPVIPPRPYRPPRPFPPPSSSPHPSSSSQSQHRNRTHKTTHGDPRYKRPPQPTATDARCNSLDSAKRPDISGQQQSHDRSHVTAPQDDKSHDASHDQPLSSIAETHGGEGTRESAENSDKASRTLYDANATNKSMKHPPHSGGKGHRLFKSMKHGLSKIRHKNSRSSSVSTTMTSNSEVVGANSLPETEEEQLYPDPLPQGIVDPLVVLCVAYLNRDSVLKEAGLFRIPGDFATVKKLRSDYIRGEPVDLMRVLDPHTVAGLMKCHFREWRMSIIPRGKPLNKITAAVNDKDEDKVRDVLQDLSRDSVATLRMVTELLSKVVEYSEWNKMTSGTLATSCGPSFFPYLPPSPANTLLKFMIDHCTTLFPE